MKKIILTCLGLFFTVIIFSSYENGIASLGYDRTGANGTYGSCSDSILNCHHNPGSGSLMLSIFLTDSVGNTFSSGYYTPGSYYRVTLRGTLPAGGGPYPEYGFEFTTGSLNDGAFIVTSNTLQSTTFVGGYQYIEQKAPIAATSASVFESYFYWKAPNSGAGDIGFYATMLVANGDHTSNGDLDRNEHIILQENPTTAIDNVSLNTTVSVTPNPFCHYVNLDINTTGKGICSVEVYNLSGQKIYSDNYQIVHDNTSAKINTSAWISGLYLISIRNGQDVKTLKVVKQ